jgi:hypothetical protein
MTKSFLGLASLFCLGVAAIFLGYIMIFNPYSGHGGSGWFWLAVLFLALGAFLALLHFTWRAFKAARSSGARAGVVSLALGVGLMPYLWFRHLGGHGSAWLVMTAFALVAVGVLLRKGYRIGRARDEGEG